MIHVKTASEIRRMRVPCALTGELRAYVAGLVRPGVSTKELDDAAARWIAERGVKSAFLGYHGYPANICVSINDVVVHGIPSPHEIIQDGDIVSIDFGVVADGFVGDCATTVLAGVVAPRTRELCRATRESLAAGIAAAKDGAHLTDIGHAVQTVAEAAGFGVVRDYCGHGIGRNMHEDPSILNYGRPGRGPVLKSGMVLAIEPMITQGTYKVEVMDDGWTVRTRDRLPAAHYENTVLVTPSGGEVLTLPDIAG